LVGNSLKKLKADNQSNVRSRRVSDRDSNSVTINRTTLPEKSQKKILTSNTFCQSFIHFKLLQYKL
jgi:hypothetical protein